MFQEKYLKYKKKYLDLHGGLKYDTKSYLNLHGGSAETIQHMKDIFELLYNLIKLLQTKNYIKTQYPSYAKGCKIDRIIKTLDILNIETLFHSDSMMDIKTDHLTSLKEQLNIQESYITENITNPRGDQCWNDISAFLKILSNCIDSLVKYKENMPGNKHFRIIGIFVKELHKIMNVNNFLNLNHLLTEYVEKLMSKFELKLQLNDFSKPVEKMITEQIEENHQRIIQCQIDKIEGIKNAILQNESIMIKQIENVKSQGRMNSRSNIDLLSTTYSTIWTLKYTLMEENKILDIINMLIDLITILYVN